MDLLEIKNKIKNMIDETDEDEQVNIIIKTGIDESYSKMCKVDKKLNRAYLPIINGICQMPEDFISLAETKPKLNPSDKLIGSQILTSKKGSLEVLYNYMREPLINDTQVPDIDLSLQNAMVNYVCYKYYQYRKKPQIAEMFLGSYNNTVQEYLVQKQESEETISYDEEYVQDVYDLGGFTWKI